MISLQVHVCKARRGYKATWYGKDAERNAIRWMSERTSTHAFWELEESPIGDEYPDLIDWLYPTCEHGLSLDLCDGPNHYPADNPYDY